MAVARPGDASLTSVAVEVVVRALIAIGVAYVTAVVDFSAVADLLANAALTSFDRSAPTAGACFVANIVVLASTPIADRAVFPVADVISAIGVVRALALVRAFVTQVGGVRLAGVSCADADAFVANVFARAEESVVARVARAGNTTLASLRVANVLSARIVVVLALFVALEGHGTAIAPHVAVAVAVAVAIAVTSHSSALAAITVANRVTVVGRFVVASARGSERGDCQECDGPKDVGEILLHGISGWLRFEQKSVGRA